MCMALNRIQFTIANDLQLSVCLFGICPTHIKRANVPSSRGHRSIESISVKSTSKLISYKTKRMHHVCMCMYKCISCWVISAAS